MSLYTLELMKELLDRKVIPKDRVWQIVDELKNKSIKVTETKMLDPDIDWEEDTDIIMDHEMMRYTASAKANSETMINNFVDNLYVLKVIKYFLGDKNIKGLETTEKRLKFWMNLEASQKNLIEILYKVLEKEISSVRKTP